MSLRALQTSAFMWTNRSHGRILSRGETQLTGFCGVPVQGWTEVGGSGEHSGGAAGGPGGW